jgi:hypothetical protein
LCIGAVLVTNDRAFEQMTDDVTHLKTEDWTLESPVST